MIPVAIVTGKVIPGTINEDVSPVNLHQHHMKTIVFA
jgi:hypothetical protein